MGRKWYFISTLSSNNTPEAEKLFEVQILDKHGRAIAAGRLTLEAVDLMIAGQQIPKAVIEAAKLCQEGKGNYVNRSGVMIQPF